MFSQRELIDMVATEAVEDIVVRDFYQSRQPCKEKAPERTANYNLRLVCHPDGRLEWKD